MTLSLSPYIIYSSPSAVLHFKVVFDRPYMTYHMELELGLALPTYHLKNGFEPTESVGSDKWSDVSCLETKKRVKTKRAFNNAFEEKGGLAAFPTLPLLSWSDQPNEEDDRNKAQKKRLTLTSIDRCVCVREWIEFYSRDISIWLPYSLAQILKIHGTRHGYAEFFF